MKAFYFVIFFGLLSPFVNAEIYQITDSEGNVSFTDRSEEGAKEKPIFLPKDITIKKHTADSKQTTTKPSLGKIKKEEQKALPYQSFSVASPADNSAIRANTGNVSFQLKVSPSLQTKFGHRIKAELDGVVRSTGRSQSVLISNIDRGTHVFRAFIVDKSGKQLKASSSVTFHVQRFSHLFESP